MTKLKYTPEIRERAVQLLIESEKKIIHRIGLQSQQLRLRLVVLLKHFVPGIKSI
jgi:transposase-like protein